MMTVPSFVWAGPLRVVVENFTYDNCYFNPDAEAVLLDIYQRYDDVLILSCYDDFMTGPVPEERRADILSVCKRRKFEYSQWNDLYVASTPLVMMNGRYDAGSRFPQVIQSGVTLARAVDHIEAIDIQRRDGGLELELPFIDSDVVLDLMVFVYTPQSVRDEDHDIFVINPVRFIDDVGDWSGDRETRHLPLRYGESGMRVFVMAQEHPYGAVRAAGSYDIP